jgi:hypothetical protein
MAQAACNGWRPVSTVDLLPALKGGDFRGSRHRIPASTGGYLIGSRKAGTGKVMATGAMDRTDS